VYEHIENTSDRAGGSRGNTGGDTCNLEGISCDGAGGGLGVLLARIEADDL
jgi:hypothetical protein